MRQISSSLDEQMVTPVSNPFECNPHYLAYVDLLTQLHVRLSLGRDDDAGESKT